ncbi:EH signature domain-containing protein [Shewanella sp. D64]|uniref:EH signature domain-containing protein n=1 Tax=unclassified Shewanella TaxID=196818 RepID=UPI0022BA696C|nr:MULTISPECIES: EH signature domain-containing protein [unclassified Shewanella]MEC4726800.1 EH signature domain-containing protein [Shewanella sp. D64]MEC4739088.1 EH signature domain-containing protein [Shewanella sp. E94]WBJ95944.1 EH signature domain-containing protein [Shewanella sp. MTB7]
MSLKAKLNQLPIAFNLNRHAFEHSKLDIATQRALITLGEFDAAKPSEFELQAEYRKAIAAIAEPFLWPKLSKRSLRTFAWMLFSAPSQGRDNLMAIDGFWLSYSQELARRQYKRGWLTIYYVLMLTYPYQRQGFEAIRQSLSYALRYSFDHKSMTIWGRCEEFDLLEPNGHKALLHYLDDGESLDELYERAGLTGALATGKLAQLTYLEFLNKTKPLLASHEWQKQTVDQILRESITQQRALKYPSYRAHLIEALLLPFQQQKPRSDVKETIKGFVLGYFKDPRVHNGLWANVSEVAKKVFLSWMVESTLEDFFSLLDYVSRGDETADRHWRYRKAFWKAYLDVEAIDEAWLVLGPYAKSMSNQFLKGGSSYGAFMRGSGVSSRHSALILRIGNLIITEWSHSGSYRAWLDTSKYTPRFYLTEYSKQMLVQMPYLEEGHHGSVNGGWQSKLSDFIKSYTGITIRYNNYMRV